MSDSSGSSKSPEHKIPTWQRAAASAQPRDNEPPSDSTPEQKPAPDAQEADAKQVAVAETALKWLEDPSIQDASRERKVAFLLSKGVARDDIDRLLPKKPAPRQQHPAQEELKEIHASAGTDKAALAQVTTSTSVPAQSHLRSEVPPVITYPEFLLQPQEKPPLVTTQRLTSTVYVAGGLIATIYGLSKYVIAPMADSLTVARHDFLQHTATQVDELNSRLEKNVSRLPISALASDGQKGADGEPPSPTDSDPTELFHRDVATQTTPTLSREPSSSNESNVEETKDSVARQAQHIRTLDEHIGNLRTSSDAHIDGPLSEVKSTLSDLTQYLTDMSYNSSYYGTGYGGVEGRSIGGGMFTGANFGHGADGDTKNKSDAIDALKAEIRSVKGVLLSARNFPAGRSMTAGR